MYALIQTSSGGTNTGASTVAPIVASPLTIGNLAVVCVEWGAASPIYLGTTVTSITDDGSNIYHQAPGALVESPTFYRHCDIWYANITGAASTITIHYSHTQPFGGACVTEWSGGATSSPLVSASNIDEEVGSAPVSPSLTPTKAGQLLISVNNSNTSGESGVSAPWTATAGGTDANAYYINAPLSPQQAQFIPNTAQPYVASGAVFDVPAVGPSAKQKASTFQVF